MTSTWRTLLISKSGATAMEYGLIAALISIAIIGSVTALGQSIEIQFDRVETTIRTPSS